MSPVSKKAKRAEQSEKELEGFLFGDDTEELWSKTGQELDQKLDNKDDQLDEEDEEEGTEEVSTSCLQKLFFVAMKLTCTFRPSFSILDQSHSLWTHLLL